MQHFPSWNNIFSALIENWRDLETKKKEMSIYNDFNKQRLSY